VDVFKTGKGNRVGGEAPALDEGTVQAIMVGHDVDQDTARAMAASMMEPVKPLPSSKEAIRAARLAALGL